MDPGVESRAVPLPNLLEQLLRPLREHRLFIVVFVVSALASALVLTYVYSERYRAETTIFFKSSDVRRLNKNNSTMALGSPLPPTLPYKVITQTINSFAVSDQLLRKVVIDLGLYVSEPQNVSGPWYVQYYRQIKDWLSDAGRNLWSIARFGRVIDQDPVDKAIATLRKDIKIRNDDSYIYTLQVTAKSPQRAVAIADAVSAGLIGLVDRNENRPAQQEIIKITRLRDGRLREIDHLESRLRDLLAGAKIASIKEEIDKTTALAAQLQQNRSNATADLRQSDTKLRRLREKLRLLTPSAALAKPVAAPQPSRLTPEDYAKLTTDRHAAEVETASLRARLDSVEQSISEVVQRLQMLNRMQAAYELTSAQLDSAKRDYAALSDAYQELVIRTAAGQTELRALEKAMVPQLPVSPIKIYHMAAAGFVAALLAIGLAFVFDFFDIHVFRPPARGRRRRSERLRLEAPEDGQPVAAE